MFIQNYKFIVLLCFLITSVSLSQIYQRVIDSPNIFGSIGLYNNIYSGGFNNPEHQFVDIDADSDFDLFFLIVMEPLVA